MAPPRHSAAHDHRISSARRFNHEGNEETRREQRRGSSLARPPRSPREETGLKNSELRTQNSGLRTLNPTPFVGSRERVREWAPRDEWRSPGTAERRLGIPPGADGASGESDRREEAAKRRKRRKGGGCVMRIPAHDPVRVRRRPPSPSSPPCPRRPPPAAAPGGRDHAARRARDTARHGRTRTTLARALPATQGEGASVRLWTVRL